MGKKYKTNYVAPKINLEPRKLIKYDMKVKKPKRISYWHEIDKGISMLVNRQPQSRLLIVLFDNESRMFPEMCICAPVYANLREQRDWSPIELNEIKTNGISLHHRTRLIFKLKMGEDYKLKPSCIYPTFILGSHHVNILIGNECLNDADIMSNEDIVKLQNLINTNNGVILVVKNRHFSFWKNSETYIAYTPNHKEHIDRSYLLKSNTFDLVIEYLKKTYRMKDKFSAFCLKILGTEKIEENPESIMDKYYELLAAELPIRDICEPEPYVKDDKEQLLLERKEVDHGDRVDFDYFEIKFSDDYFNELFEDRGFLSGSTYCKKPDAVLHTNMAAAIFVCEIRSIKWTKETVNDIIRLGKKIFSDSEMDGCILIPDWTKKIFMPIQFNNKELEIEFENLVFGQVITQEKNVYTLKQGIQIFFKQNDLGLIWGPQVQLIWQQNGLFFTFSPKERDAIGRKWMYELSKELPENKRKTKGTAVVSWFKSPVLLSDAYLSNVSLKHRRDQFRIVKVKFLQAKKELIDWNNWTCYLDDKWRLIGEKTICDFLEPDRYELSYPKIFCIATMVALFHTSRTTSKWDKKTVDELLNFGNIYYEESVLNKPELEDNFDMQKLKKYYVLLNKSFLLFFTSCAVSGFVFQPMRTSPVLQKGFVNFFCNYQFGVLVIRDIAIPIFMENQFYYMIFVYDKTFGTKDTCLCSLENLYSTVRGHAYILRFKNISDMYEELIRCMAVEENDRYCIHAIEKRYRKDLLNYTPLGTTGAQLRAVNNIHEGSEMFGLRANKQTMANLLIAICYAFITRPMEWEQAYVNEILELGDRILCRLLANDKNCKEKYFELTLDHVIPFVGTNKFTFVQKSNFGVFKFFPPLPANGEEEEGIMEEEEGENAEHGAVIEDMDLDGEEGGAINIVPTYDKDLEMMLQAWKNVETGWGILLSRLFNLALWKKEEVYFVFDPKITDIEGMPTPRRMAMVIDKILDDVRPSYGKLPNKGSAYVAYFYTLETFVDHILLRVPEEFIKDKLNFVTLEIFSPVIVNKDIEYKKTQTFRDVNANQGIIRSNISQDEPLFYYRNRQESAMGLVALAFASLSNPAKWSSEMLDLILRYGDRLYIKSLEIEKDDHPVTFDITKKLPLKNIQLKFYIYKVKFELKLIQNLSNCVSSYSDNTELRRFLTKMPAMKPNNIGCLITCKGYTNALFKLGQYIFSFDPHKTDPEGYFSGDGLSNYSRFPSPETYLEFFVNKYLCEKKNNKFEIIQFEVVKTYPLGLVAFDFEKYEFSKKLPKNQLIFKDIGDDMKLMSYYYEHYEIPDSFLCIGAILCGKLKYVEYWDYNEMKKVSIIADYIRSQLQCKDKRYGPDILEEINYTIRIDNKLCNLNVSHVSEASIGKELDSSNYRLRHILDRFFPRKKYCIVGNADGYCYGIWYDALRYYMYWLDHDIMQTKIQSAPDWKSLYNVIAVEGKPTNKVYYVMYVQTYIIELNQEFLLDIKPKFKKSPIDKKRGCERFEFPELCEKCYYNSFDYNLKQMWKHTKKSKESFKWFAQGIDIFQPCYHLKDHRFYDSESYFSYLQACCLLAAAMFSIKGFEFWDKKTIDNILKSGNDLYVASVGVNRKTSLDITEFEQVFTLCTITIKVIALAPTKEFFELQNLLTILKYILRKHKMAYLMESDNICITLITDEVYYYIFYPGSVTPPNLCKESTCIIRFDSLERMARFIIESYKVGTNYITIGPIVTIEKCNKPIRCICVDS